MGKGFTFTLLFTLAISMFLTACGNSNSEITNNSDDTANTNSSGEQVVKSDEPNEQNSKNSTIDNGGSVFMEDVEVKLTFNNEEVIVNMYDNPTSRDFVAQLPLTVTFEDYARTEKISYLPKKLSTNKAPSGSDPSVGDFAYYAPWGNVVIYYRDFGYSNGLITLGKIESGIEKLERMNGNFTVQIEKID